MSKVFKTVPPKTTDRFPVNELMLPGLDAVGPLVALSQRWLLLLADRRAIPLLRVRRFACSAATN